MKTELNNIKKQDITSLLFAIRVISTLLLFEGIFMLAYIACYLSTTNSIRLIEKLNNPDPSRPYMYYVPYLIGICVLYISFIFVNYFVAKYKFKYSKQLLILEIIVLIIAMDGLFIAFRGL